MKAKDIKIDAKQLERQKRANFQERLKFIDFWVGYIKTHSDSEWSIQQNVIIDAQLEG
ncbi:MAG TPA: hypothetical protein VJA86_01595 [Candidatus Nanoarchaeia archaeon]|nr:hypothetical protein [Candidatus Woesearchaeota archaeon]HLD37260.1 hypothetical protein [Candidatus Nanoarchaeia archaeon]